MVVSGSYIRAFVLAGFAEFVSESGGDPKAILREAEIDPAALRDMDRLISFSAAGRLCEIAAAHLRRPSFGIEWAVRMRPHFENIGPLRLFNLFVRDVREWIETLLRYYRYSCTGFSVQMCEEGEVVRIRTVPDPLAFRSRHQTENGMANAALVVRDVIRHEAANPLLVRFRHARPQDISMHKTVFACPIEFDADHDEMVFQRGILDLPLGGRLHLLKPLVDHFIRYRLQRMPQADQTMTATVALAIPTVLGAGKCSAEFIADMLGVTPKKLQRLLAEEGTNFSILLDRVRSTMAGQMMAESDAPVSRIAGLLDYSATAPFTIAFRRWFGQSPTAFRRARHQDRYRSEAAACRPFGLDHQP